MQKDNNHDARPSALPDSPSNSDQDTSFGGFPQSAKLREKRNRLANQRLDISSIEFVKDAPEWRGGFATVSRAVLVSPSRGQDRTSQSNPTKKGGLASPGPAGEASRRRKVGGALPSRVIDNDDGRPINSTLQDVAVKKMNMSDDPAQILGLTLREAEFLVGLSHENIITLEGFVEDLPENMVWLVFPWAENGNLRNFIASAEWEIPERIWLIDDVARGVEYLHSQQPPIRHGDLKSINILINSEYRAVITDFGSARRVTAEDLNKQMSQVENEPQAGLSLESKFCGPTNAISITLTSDQYTLRWAAPELLREEEATVASDTWALGCVAYEVMTNSIPFQDIKDAVVVMRIIRGDLPSISDNARMSLIQALCSMILACWSIDPRKRPTAENCRESFSWMPMIRPDPIRTVDAAASRARSPALLMQLGSMHVRQGDYGSAEDCFKDALGAYGDVGDSKGKATALVQLAQVHRLRNEYNQAVTFYNEALQIRTDIDDRQGRADALWGLAEVHRARTEYSEAVTFYTEALQIRTDIGDREGRADAIWGLAGVHRMRNEYSQAVTFYTEALQTRTDIGDRQGRADALLCLAEMHRVRNEYSQAITLYTEALQIYTDIGDRHRRASTLKGLADIHRVQSEYSQAVTFYTEALQIRTDIGDRQGRADALLCIAEMHRVRNEYSQAITLYTEALQIRTDVGDRQGTADTLRGLAAVHRLQGQYSQAIQRLSEALQVHNDFGDRNGRAWTLMCLGDVQRDQDQHADAKRFYEQAARIFGEIGNTRGEEAALARAATARQRLELTATE